MLGNEWVSEATHPPNQHGQIETGNTFMIERAITL
jgi:hypothetical protein